VTVKAKTRAESVFIALRADILTGRLLPGARLPFADLTERYSCSMSVVREGLTRLVELGLVRTEPQYGFHVTPLSIADLEDLTTARVHIEGPALGYAIDHGDIAWEARIVAAGHRLARTPQMAEDDPRAFNEDWTAAHALFHASLIDACPNIRLKMIANELRDAAEMYRRWTKPIANDTNREHLVLMEAVLAHDRVNAVELLERHLRRTADVLIMAAQTAYEETTQLDGSNSSSTTDAKQQSSTRHR
jgi:DNA-binding GntR family transcriptional regulator